MLCNLIVLAYDVNACSRHFNFSNVKETAIVITRSVPLFFLYLFTLALQYRLNLLPEGI